jgi:hypothetical protein
MRLSPVWAARGAAGGRRRAPAHPPSPALCVRCATFAGEEIGHPQWMSTPIALRIYAGT